MNRSDYTRAAKLAEQVLRKNNGFLDSLPPEAICPEGYVPAIRNWVVLRGWRLTENEQKDALLPLQAVSQWLHSGARNGHTGVVYIERERERINLRFGTSGQNQPSNFAAQLPGCRLEKTPWFRPRHYPYNGFVLGTISAERLSDAIAADERLRNAAAAMVAVPVSDTEAGELLRQEEAVLHQLEGCATYDRVYGSATRREVKVPVGQVGEAVTRLNAELKSLRAASGQGLVYTVMKFGAATESEYIRLKQLLGAALQADDGTAFEPVRCVTLNAAEDFLAIPTVTLRGNTISLLSLNTVPSAARWALPPQHAYPGYWPEGQQDEEIFAAVPPLPVQSSDFVIGSARKGGAAVAVQQRELLSHCLIAGSNGSGKTTLVKNLLREDARLQVPFVVLELAKKEYFLLKREIPALRVLGSGADCLPLRLNPLQPEAGVLIEAHAEALVRALCASTGSEHPLPECFEAIFKLAYERCGWHYGELAYEDPARPWPAFSDVLRLVRPYMNRYGNYGPEVKQNVTAALEIRARKYTTGALGRLFDCRKGMTAADLLCAPTVVELGDFSADSVSFLANMLLFKFQSYFGHQEESRTLRQMIVIEEAHNAFRKCGQEESTAGQNHLALAKMLAEVRAFGTSVVVVDQSAALLPDAVLSNTCVKVAMGQDSPTDRQLMAAAMGLTDRQERELSRLQPGEAVLAARGRRDAVQFAVTPPAAGACGAGTNAACLHCGCAEHCKRAPVEKLLETVAPETLRKTVQRLTANPYRGDAVARCMEDFLRQAGVKASPAVTLCLLGSMLERAGTPNQLARLIVTTYRKEILHDE